MQTRHPLSCVHVLSTITSLVIQDVCTRHSDKTLCRQDTLSTRDLFLNRHLQERQKCSQETQNVGKTPKNTFVLRCVRSLVCMYCDHFFCLSCMHVLSTLFCMSCEPFFCMSCLHILLILFACLVNHFFACIVCISCQCCLNVLLSNFLPVLCACLIHFVC